MKRRVWPLEVRFGLEVCYAGKRAVSEGNLPRSAAGLSRRRRSFDRRSVIRHAVFPAAAVAEAFPSGDSLSGLGVAVGAIRSVRSDRTSDTVKMGAQDVTMDPVKIRRIAEEAKRRGGSRWNAIRAVTGAIIIPNSDCQRPSKFWLRWERRSSRQRRPRS